MPPALSGYLISYGPMRVPRGSIGASAVRVGPGTGAVTVPRPAVDHAAFITIETSSRQVGQTSMCDSTAARDFSSRPFEAYAAAVSGSIHPAGDASFTVESTAI